MCSQSVLPPRPPSAAACRRPPRSPPSRSACPLRSGLRGSSSSSGGGSSGGMSGNTTQPQRVLLLLALLAACATLCGGRPAPLPRRRLHATPNDGVLAEGGLVSHWSAWGFRAWCKAFSVKQNRWEADPEGPVLGAARSLERRLLLSNTLLLLGCAVAGGCIGVRAVA